VSVDVPPTDNVAVPLAEIEVVAVAVVNFPVDAVVPPIAGGEAKYVEKPVPETVDEADSVVKAPEPALVDPMDPGDAKVAPLSDDAFRFATFVVDVTAKGAVPVAIFEISWVPVIVLPALILPAPIPTEVVPVPFPITTPPRSDVVALVVFENVSTAVKVWVVPRPATVVEAPGKVITVESVPANSSEFSAFNVFELAIVSVPVVDVIVRPL
jgi:hypothetical protein